MRRSLRKRRREPAPPADDGPPLGVDVTSSAYGALVTIAGEIDIATAPRVSAALASPVVARARAVVVDLTGVTFMDSTGLATLLTLQRDLGGRRGRLVIACPEGAARLLLDVTGIGDTIELHWTREAAEAAISAPPGSA